MNTSNQNQLAKIVFGYCLLYSQMIAKPNNQ